MRSYSNIEKSAFRKGQYVGYSLGVWQIMKSNSSYGNWYAVKQYETNITLFAHTLDDMSEKLTAWEKSNSCKVHNLSTGTEYIFQLPAEQALISCAILYYANAGLVTDQKTRDEYQAQITRGKHSIAIKDLAVKTDIHYEYTDTFGGEANYSWVKRGVIPMPPGKDYSDLTAVRLVKKALGLNGVPCARESAGDEIWLKPRNSCTIVFISFYSHGSAS